MASRRFSYSANLAATLRDSVDDAAQVAAGDGQLGTQSRCVGKWKWTTLGSEVPKLVCGEADNSGPEGGTHPWWQWRSAAARPDALGMAVIPDFRGATLIAFLRAKRGTGLHRIHRRPQEFHRIGGSWITAMCPAVNRSRTELHKGAKSVVPLADRAIGNLKQWLTRNPSRRGPRSAPGLS